MAQLLKQCGDDLTRENVMRQAANLKDVSGDMLLPGIKINTGPDDFFPIEQMQLMKFDGRPGSDSETSSPVTLSSIPITSDETAEHISQCDVAMAVDCTPRLRLATITAHRITCSQLGPRMGMRLQESPMNGALSLAWPTDR